MIDRRAFLSLLASAAVVPSRVPAQSEKLALYASVGRDLTHYDVDVAAATLVKRGSATLPGGVQYAWPHASRRYLYVASSNGGPNAPGDTHHGSAFRIEPASGALRPHGEPIVLRSRPIHLTTESPRGLALRARRRPRQAGAALQARHAEDAQPVDAPVRRHHPRAPKRPVRVRRQSRRRDDRVAREARLHPGREHHVVYAIDERSGEPTPIQHADTRGIHVRTFHIDPSGRLLVAGSLRPLLVKEGVAIRNVPGRVVCLQERQGWHARIRQEVRRRGWRRHVVLDGHGRAAVSTCVASHARPDAAERLCGRRCVL
jgi:hypothetical protein